MTRALQTALVALLVVLAGCGGAATGGTGGSTDAATTASTTDAATATAGSTDGDSTDGGSTDGSSTDSETSDVTAPAGDGTLRFYVSDEPNAIDDFEHLNVTITKIGLQKGGESGSWVEHDVDSRTVDLTRLQGDNATLLGEFEVENGTYHKVFVYVSDVNGTLKDGSSTRVKLPSQKLQLNKPFTVGPNQSVDFVFDIGVHKAGKSGKHILRPTIGESGTDVPIDEVDDEGDDKSDEGDDESDDEEAEHDLNATFLGDVSPGSNATVQVTRNGTAVENATVEVTGEVDGNETDVASGTTDADGNFTFLVPENASSIEVTVTDDGGEAELEREFEQELEASFLGDVTAGENATVQALRDGEAVEGATVDADATVDGNVTDVASGTTDADGNFTFMVPENATSVTVVVSDDGDTVTLERDLT